jgi:hypothetical protein
MNILFSKVVNTKLVILVELENGVYQIKSGNFSQTFKRTPYNEVFDYYMGFK